MAATLNVTVLMPDGTPASGISVSAIPVQQFPDPALTDAVGNPITPAPSLVVTRDRQLEAIMKRPCTCWQRVTTPYQWGMDATADVSSTTFAVAIFFSDEANWQDPYQLGGADTGTVPYVDPPMCWKLAISGYSALFY